jgi:hypothetical protein
MQGTQNFYSASGGPKQGQPNPNAERSGRRLHWGSMGSLASWKEAELRHLAEQFRKRAAETRQIKYVELLKHAADELEMQADLHSLHDDDDPKTPHHIDIHI